MTTPEITGYSRNPTGIWNNKKSFSAGNRLSSNAVTTCTFSKENIGAMYQDYQFPLIERTAETEEACYFDERELYKHALVRNGPTADEDNFYFTAFYSKGINFADSESLSTILTSRNRLTGKSNWSRNTRSYYQGLETLYSISWCKMAPAIYGDVLYLIDSVPTPNGPVVFAVDKHTGNLKWSLELGRELIPSKTRVGEANINVASVNGKPNLFFGITSVQHITNTGYSEGMSKIYTDQGYLFRVQDNGNSGEIVTSIPTCAPLLYVGDKVTSDSFLPGRDSIIISTTSVGKISNAYVFVDNPRIPPPKYGTIEIHRNPIPIGSIYKVDGIVDMGIFQDAFSLTDTLYLGHITSRTFTKQEVLDIFNSNPNLYIIYTYLREDQKEELEAQINNKGVIFFKEIREGIIENEWDAQGLNYYGNGILGAPVTIAQDNIYFGTGQAHSIPFEELAYYIDTGRSFRNFDNLVDESTIAYAKNQTSENLQKLNTVKREFERVMIEESNSLSGYSPRGLLSYSDAIFDVTVGLTKKWAQRTLPIDVYDGYDSYDFMLRYEIYIEGNLASGIQLFNFTSCSEKRKVVATVTQARFGVVIDVSGEQGVFRYNTYLGKLSPLNIVDNQCSQSLGSLLLSNHTNSDWHNNDAPPFVTSGGELIKDGTSYNTAMNVNTGVVEWNASLDSLTISDIANVNGMLLSSDYDGGLYAHDDFSGKRLLKFDTKTSLAPGGGVSSACVLEDRILWTPAYNLFEYGNGAEFGASYKIDESEISCSLVGTYVSVSPQGVVVTQKWNSNSVLVEIPLSGVKAKFEVEKNKCGNWEFSLDCSNDPLTQISFSKLEQYSGLRYQLYTKINDVEWNALYERKV